MARLMVIIGFLVAFAAGLTVGLEARRPRAAKVVDPPTPAQPVAATGPTTTSRPTTRQSRTPSWIVSQLKLDEDQQKRMNEIWSAVARGGREEMDRQRKQLRDTRDAQLLALLGPQNKEKYEAIHKDYYEGQKQLERDMRARFEKAVEETMAILNPEQQKKYKEMLNRHRSDRDRDGDRRGGDRDKSRDGDRDKSRDDQRRGDRGPEDRGPQKIEDDPVLQAYAKRDDCGDGQDVCDDKRCQSTPGPRNATARAKS